MGSERLAAGLKAELPISEAVARAQRDAQRQADRIRELFLAAAVTAASADEQIAQTLALGCRLIGCEAGSVFELDRAPQTTVLPERLCRLALGTEGTLAIDDLAGLPYVAEDDDGKPSDFVAYVGAPIMVRGVVVGTLNFASKKPRDEPFSETDRDLVQLIGALIGSAIDRRRSRERLRRLAYFDTLTGLPNRVQFVERLRETVTAIVSAGERKRLAVVFLDLDHFKEINDTFGHGRGDAVLSVVGERLRERVGEHGMVARMSGDEFAVLLESGEDLGDLDAFSESLRAAIDAPIVIGGYEQYATASIGVSIYPDDGADAETLVKHADVAMYRAKEKGRNFVQFYTPVLNAAMTTRLQQEKALRKALARSEFLVYYQPQFELATSRLFGIEALVRWHHPKLGLIRPDLFIPNAESSSVIVLIGELVMEMACQQLVKWQARGLPELRVSVNLSARQFHETDLLKRARSVLDSTGLNPETLEFEITESVAMDDAERSTEIMRTLRDVGIRFCLDDFGTGYSSLGYLKSFPIDTLKIDQSFVRDIMTEQDDATIVRTVIAMAHNLGLDVCAEGTETEDQLNFLRQNTCDRVQGYFYSRPVPPEEFERFVDDALAAKQPAQSEAGSAV
ncbi:MAG: EAL domain-containing protein [Candidatus Eremiobacteraeota bacterium]|nr:EAL domain-containing protein [Candidatus Eremiobacteraeota bacterium]